MIDLIVIIVGHLNICNGLEMVWTLIGYVLMDLPIIATFIILLTGLIKLIKGSKKKRKLIDVFKETLLKAIVISIVLNITFKLLMIGGKYLTNVLIPNNGVICVFDINEHGCDVRDCSVTISTEE